MNGLYVAGGFELVLDGALDFLKGNLHTGARCSIVIGREIQFYGLQFPAAHIAHQGCPPIVHAHRYLAGERSGDDHILGHLSELQRHLQANVKRLVERLQKPETIGDGQEKEKDQGLTCL